VIDGSTSAPLTLTAGIADHIEQFAPVTAVSTTAPQSASTEATMLGPACGASAGESFNADWSARNAVEIEPAHAEAARPTETVAETAKSESAHADLATAETISREIASSPEAECARVETASVDAAATEPEPVRVTENAAVSVQQSTAQWMGLAAAAVIAVAAMGVPLGVWLGTRHQVQPEPRQAAAPLPAASAATKDREVLAPKPQAAAVAQPSTAVPVVPSAKASTRTAAKTARKFETTPRPITLQSVPVQEIQGLAASPVVEPRPVAETPRSVAPTPPTGRLFEPADVDESPRVATRVEPQLPDDVVKRFPNDVVVVRVLVSQAGHPFRVSLLRRSLGGRSLDDVVVAAVSQWTFSPARKRGEAVSCWMNFGVPIGR
jgi:hypothetical protein